MFFLDNLSLFFMFLTLLSAAATLLSERQHPLRVALATLALFLAYVTAFLPLMVLAYGAAMLMAGFHRSPPLDEAPAPTWLARYDVALRGVVWSLFPCVALGVAGAVLWWASGSWWLHAPLLALTGFNSLSFWFVLLATLVGSGLLHPAHASFAPPPMRRTLWPASLLTTAWCYPLLRLLALAPWNAGWHEATLLAGGALALWGAWQAFASSTLCMASAPDAPGRTLAATLWRPHAGIALAAIGSGTQAGVVVGCYALLVVVLVETTTPFCANGRRPHHTGSWFLSGTIPLTAPFMSVWMGASAVAAYQQGWLTLALWGAVMLTTIAITSRCVIRTGPASLARSRAPAHPAPPRPAAWTGWVSGWVVRRDNAPRTPDRFDVQPQTPAPTPQTGDAPRACTVAMVSSVLLGIATIPIIQHLLRPVAQHIATTPAAPAPLLWPWGYVLSALSPAPNSGAGGGGAMGLSVALTLLLLIPGALAWFITRPIRSTPPALD